MLHITIAHVLYSCIQMRTTSCACMWHACGAEPIFVYAAHMQYGCIVCAAHVQHICTMCAARVLHICTICAARKQIYVQHTSNISVRACTHYLFFIASTVYINVMPHYPTTDVRAVLCGAIARFDRQCRPRLGYFISTIRAR